MSGSRAGGRGWAGSRFASRTRVRALRLFGAFVVLGVIWSLAAGAPASAAPVTVSFALGKTTFTVPDEVTSLQFTARGAVGGTGAGAEIEGPGGTRGAGSQVTGTLAVTPGDVLTVVVGQNGADGGTQQPDGSCDGGGGKASNGFAPGGDGGCPLGISTGQAGGGGGQATSVSGSSSVGLLLIAAGGGGGGGAGAIDFAGGAGGFRFGSADGQDGVGTDHGSGGLSGASSTSAGTGGGQPCDDCEAGAGGGGGGGLKGGGGGTAGGVGGGSGGGGGAGTDFISASLSGVVINQSPAGAGGHFSITYAPPPFSTSTALSCSPDPVAVDAPTTCTATVTDTEAGVTSTPTGVVGFATSSAGSFDASQCTLSGSGASAHCSVTYTPSATGSHAITASYVGDALHVASIHSGTVGVQLVGVDERDLLAQSGGGGSVDDVYDDGDGHLCGDCDHADRAGLFQRIQQRRGPL